MGPPTPLGEFKGYVEHEHWHADFFNLRPHKEPLDLVRAVQALDAPEDLPPGVEQVHPQGSLAVLPTLPSSSCEKKKDPLD